MAVFFRARVSPSDTSHGCYHPGDAEFFKGADSFRSCRIASVALPHDYAEGHLPMDNTAQSASSVFMWMAAILFLSTRDMEELSKTLHFCTLLTPGEIILICKTD